MYGDYDPFYDDPFYAPRPRFGARPGAHLGIDVTDGDLVEDFGNGIGIDLDTGQVELEVFPGFDIPL